MSITAHSLVTGAVTVLSPLLPVLPFIHPSRIPVTGPDECRTSPLGSPLLITTRTQWPRTDPEGPPTVDTWLLGCQADARLLVSITPGDGLLAEQLRPVFLGGDRVDDALALLGLARRNRIAGERRPRVRCSAGFRHGRRSGRTALWRTLWLEEPFERLLSCSGRYGRGSHGGLGSFDRYGRRGILSFRPLTNYPLSYCSAVAIGKGCADRVGGWILSSSGGGLFLGGGDRLG